MRCLALVGVGVLLCAPPTASAQDVFHSTISANLPTALVLPQGTWLFEISHRFNTPISNGASDFWGLDGPVRNRLGLTYSITDRVALGVQRSNFADNVDVNLRVGALSLSSARFAVETAVAGGVAWNTQVTEIDGAKDNELQAYGHVVVNARIGERIVLGVVPTYLYNPRLLDFDEANAFGLGINGQLYFTDSMSLLGEWLVSESRLGQEKDAGTFGLEIETRGHFFKLLVTNQALLNPSQFLGGTPTPFEPDDWRFGFNIQRVLPF